MTTSSKPPPQLPQGNASILQGISENFSFHSSPESFIAARIMQWQQQNPDAVDKRIPIRAKILNRNVAIVSSYDHIKAILESSQSESETERQCVAGAAYNDLMAEFFPGPNLLLADGRAHANMRRGWDERLGNAQSQYLRRAHTIIDEFLEQTPLNRPLDLYEHMKSFAWSLLLGCFLNLQPSDSLFLEIQRLQEDLLRGQFSLMPVSINTGFWRSPRKRGINARKSLQTLLRQRLSSADSSNSTNATTTANKTCLFDNYNQHAIPHLADHILMMTSSLAAKGLASLLTAFLLNLFLLENKGVPLCLSIVNQSQDSTSRRDLLHSIYLETERLSPPIVGIMRRTTTDVILPSNEEDNDDDSIPDTLLPAGWDVWLYFLGATREKATFGESCEWFDPYRYQNVYTPLPMGFGLGPKHCLGRDLVRETCLVFAERMLERRLVVKGEVSKPGVRAWLGWEVVKPEMWPKDMKQLPTQHPVAPVMVEFVES